MIALHAQCNLKNFCTTKRIEKITTLLFALGVFSYSWYISVHISSSASGIFLWTLRNVLLYTKLVTYIKLSHGTITRTTRNGVHKQRTTACTQKRHCVRHCMRLTRYSNLFWLRLYNKIGNCSYSEGKVYIVWRKKCYIDTIFMLNI